MHVELMFSWFPKFSCLFLAHQNHSFHRPYWEANTPPGGVQTMENQPEKNKLDLSRKRHCKVGKRAALFSMLCFTAPA